jgi:hypothetical protein
MANEKKQVVIKNGQLMVEGVKSGKGELLSFYNLKLKQKEPYTDISDVRILEITGPNASRFYVQGTGSDGTNVSRSISAEGAQVVMEFFGLGGTDQRTAKPRKPRKTKRSPAGVKTKATRKTKAIRKTKSTGKSKATRKTKATGKSKATRKTSGATKKTTRKPKTTPTRKSKTTRKTSPGDMSRSNLMGMKRSELMEMARGLPGFTDKMTKAQYVDLIMASQSTAPTGSGPVRTSRRTLSPRTGRRATKKSPSKKTTRKSTRSPSRSPRRSPSRSPRRSPRTSS